MPSVQQLSIDQLKTALDALVTAGTIKRCYTEPTSIGETAEFPYCFFRIAADEEYELRGNAAFHGLGAVADVGDDRGRAQCDLCDQGACRYHCRPSPASHDDLERRDWMYDYDPCHANCLGSAGGKSLWRFRCGDARNRLFRDRSILTGEKPCRRSLIGEIPRFRSGRSA